MLLRYGGRRLCTALALSAVLMLYDCGIDIVVFLNDPPRSVEASSDSKLSFKGPSMQQAEYLGLEVFYRIYALESDATADQSALSTRLSTQTVPGDNVNSYLLAPSGLRYNRLSQGSPYKSYPASITGPADVEEVWELKVPTSTQDIALRVQDISEPSVTSYAYRVLQEPKLFSVQPIDTDIDYKAASGLDADAAEYFVQFYACSWGIDYASYQELYSNPVFLGRIRLNY